MEAHRKKLLCVADLHKINELVSPRWCVRKSFTRPLDGSSDDLLPKTSKVGKCDHFVTSKVGIIGPSIISQKKLNFHPHLTTPTPPLVESKQIIRNKKATLHDTNE